MLLAVVGTGLMGGSFALAARRHGLFEDVVGIEPDPQRRARAQALGLVDRTAQVVPPEADAVLLAGPSHSIAHWVVTLADHAGTVFDTGSVKGAVIDAVRAARGGSLPPRFVPCHPITGSEKSGPEAAQPALFSGAEIVLTPEAETDPAALALVTGWWQALGARVETMTAADHDAALAVTSHLPHLLAFAYLQQVDGETLRHAGGGFRDFTRIGAADAEMWAPVFRLNRSAVLAALDDLEGSLERVRALIAAGDDASLATFIRAAGRRRRGLADG